MKVLQHGLRMLTTHGLEQFLPSPEEWVTMETLDTCKLRPVHQRPLLRMAR